MEKQIKSIDEAILGKEIVKMLEKYPKNSNNCSKISQSCKHCCNKIYLRETKFCIRCNKYHDPKILKKTKIIYIFRRRYKI